MQNGAEMMALLPRREAKHSGKKEKGRKKLTENEAEGSDAKEQAENKVAKLTVTEAYAEVESMKRLVQEKDTVIQQLTRQLDEANKVLESQEKAKVIGEILPRSAYRMDELVGKSLEELREIRATLDRAMPPRVNSIRYGASAADVSDSELGLTVGDLSWATAQKRGAH